MEVLTVVVILTIGWMVAVPSVVVVVAWRRWRSRIFRVPYDQLGRYITLLLKRGRRDALMIIRDVRSSRFVQFARYSRPDGTVGVVVEFPEAQWSACCYDSVRRILQATGRPVKETLGCSTRLVDVLNLDCGTDVALARRVVEQIFLGPFGVTGPLQYRVHFTNVNLTEAS